MNGTSWSGSGSGSCSGGTSRTRFPQRSANSSRPASLQLKKAYQEQMLQQFGAIEESAFPPCMQALITALTAGTNLTHAGRFSITTFLHTIGMDVTGIAALYARSPDFDPEKTMYQVEHITGRGGSGTEYTAPACAAMRTTGLCVHRDPLCEKIGHPLSYYKVQKAGPGEDGAEEAGGEEGNRENGSETGREERSEQTGTGQVICP